MSEDIVQIILWESNRYAANHGVPFFKKEEIYAYFGLLLFAGAAKSHDENYYDLWADHAHPIDKATMSRRRDEQLSKCIRFDNKATREERRRTDKAAAISEIFLMVNAQLKKFYVPGENVTVDEQLFPFRGPFSFRVYIPSKPAKYGIKVYWVNDSVSSYPYKGQIYSGKAENGIRDVGQGARVVRELC